MNWTVIRYASRILAPELLILTGTGQHAYFDITARHCWIVVAPFRGIYIMIYHSAFFLPWDQVRGYDNARYRWCWDIIDYWIYNRVYLLTRIQSSQPITRFLHNWPLTSRWSHSHMILAILHTAAHSYIPTSTTHQMYASMGIHTTKPRPKLTRWKTQKNPTLTWLDDANDIIHTGNVSTTKLPLPPDETARHGCDIHDMLHSSQEAMEWPWNIRPVPSSYLVRHSERESNICPMRLSQTMWDCLHHGC